MKISIITPFPEIIEGALSASILGRAVKNGIVEYNIINLREYGEGPHKKLDDHPFSGGPGMVMMAGPIFEAFEKELSDSDTEKRVILPTPVGVKYDQKLAEELSKEKELVFICGHYKGVDERVVDSLVTDEISIGDYVLTGGEIPSLAIIDSIVRIHEEGMSDPESSETDFVDDTLLDVHHSTRPANFRGMEVPEILLSGDHKKIEIWKNELRLKRTKERRADILTENKG